MSDFPNGMPPGQNNIDAGAEPYVPPENDPSTNVPKPAPEDDEEVETHDGENATKGPPPSEKPVAGKSDSNEPKSTKPGMPAATPPGSSTPAKK